MGSFEPIITRSKGTTPQDDGTVKDVEVPEIDSDEETTLDKLMKEYSEEESEDDSDYVPSEESEVEDDSNDFVITRSKGIPPQEYGIVNDVEIPEVESEDETTVAKLMKDYSDEESDAEDSDYAPSEDSDDELEYDSDASISDDDFEHEVIEDVEMPEFRGTRKVVIEDVKIPNSSTVMIQDVPVGHTTFASIAHEFLDCVTGFAIVQTGIKALDLGLGFSEKIFTPYEDHVKNARRHLRAIRRTARNGSSLKRLFAFCLELFKVNWFLGFLGLSLTVDLDDFSVEEVISYGRRNASDDYSDDEESTVYKLMKDYDSQDDEDYIPSDCSEDSMEFESDCSEDETILEKLMIDYSEGEDSDYIPRDEDSEDDLEYDSDAEVSDAGFNSSEGEESCEETILEKIMKDYSEEESDLDADYVPEDDVERDLEYDSDASITESSDVSDDTLESEEESQEICSEEDIVDSEDESEEEDC